MYVIGRLVFSLVNWCSHLSEVASAECVWSAGQDTISLLAGHARLQHDHETVAARPYDGPIQACVCECRPLIIRTRSSLHMKSSCIIKIRICRTHVVPNQATKSLQPIYDDRVPHYWPLDCCSADGGMGSQEGNVWWCQREIEYNKMPYADILAYFLHLW